MKRARTLVEGAGWAGALVLVAGTILAALARHGWVAEMVCHLRYPLGLGGLLAAALLACARRPRVALAALLLACWHTVPAWSYALPRDVPVLAGPTLRVAHANLLFGRADPARVSAWLDDVQPDVVGFTEVMHSGRSGVDWPGVLRGWAARYPHQRIYEHRHFGMALLSKLPFEEARERVVPHGDEGGVEGGRPELIEARVVVGGTREVLLLLAHPHRPGARWRDISRAEVFDEIARTRTDATFVVFGDLNSTGYSPLFRDLLERAQLTDTRVGHGRQGSWRHALVPGHWITLDHVLVRGPHATLERALGPDVGSDHLPIHAVLRLP